MRDFRIHERERTQQTLLNVTSGPSLSVARSNVRPSSAAWKGTRSKETRSGVLPGPGRAKALPGLSLSRGKLRALGAARLQPSTLFDSVRRNAGVRAAWARPKHDSQVATVFQSLSMKHSLLSPSRCAGTGRRHSEFSNRGQHAVHQTGALQTERSEFGSASWDIATHLFASAIRREQVRRVSLEDDRHLSAVARNRVSADEALGIVVLRLLKGLDEIRTNHHVARHRNTLTEQHPGGPNFGPDREDRA